MATKSDHQETEVLPEHRASVVLRTFQSMVPYPSLESRVLRCQKPVFLDRKLPEQFSFSALKSESISDTPFFPIPLGKHKLQTPGVLL